MVAINSKKVKYPPIIYPRIRTDETAKRIRRAVEELVHLRKTDRKAYQELIDEYRGVEVVIVPG